MASGKSASPSKKMLAVDKKEAAASTHPVLILIAGFTSAFLLLFCCVCGGAAWWFQPNVREDPERAQQLLTEIVDVQIPDTYHPHGTIEWNIAYMMSIRGVYFERFAGDGLLSFVEVNSRFRSEDEVRQHIRDTLLRKGGGGTPLILDEKAATVVEVPISGELVPFQFEVGRDPPSGRVFHIVEGVFNGKNGEVLLSMRVNEDNWEKSSVITMLNSIGHPIESPAVENPNVPQNENVPENEQEGEPVMEQGTSN